MSQLRGGQQTNNPRLIESNRIESGALLGERAPDSTYRESHHNTVPVFVFFCRLHNTRRIIKRRRRTGRPNATH